MKKKTPASILLTTLFFLSSCGTPTTSSSSSSSQSSSALSSAAKSSSSQSASSSERTSYELTSYAAPSSSSEVKTTLEIYAYNDMHGNVKDTDGKGIGIAKSTTLLKQLSQNENAIFISQGDMWQGSVESNYTRGLLVTDWMNQLGFVSMTLGNHEFDWGAEAIRENRRLANFPILGLNILNKSTRQRVDYADASTIIERGGAKIGVIGTIGNCLSSISSSRVEGVYFAQGSELSALVKNEANRLRNQEGCDFIIYSTHGSGSRDEDDSYDISLSEGGYVDLVLEGHTHSRYAEKDTAGIYHIQAGANNECFYKISVDLDCKTRTFKVTPTAYNTKYNSQYYSLSPDESVNELFEKYRSYYDFVYKDLGTNEKFRNASELREIVAMLYLRAGKEKWGASYSIILGGGYESCRGNGLSAGIVKYNKLAELFPFDNDVVLCSVKASDFVNTAYYNGSNDNYFVKWSEEGERVKANLNSGSYSASDTYYIVTDTYNSDYAPNHLTVIDRLQTGGMFARDLLALYAEEGGFGGTITPAQSSSSQASSSSSASHAGTVSDPKTIREALDIASSYRGTSASSAGAPAFFFCGTVCTKASQLSGGSLKNVEIQDQDGTKILLYWLQRTSDRSIGFTSINDVKVGDKVLFYGAPFTYSGNDTPEFSSGTFIYALNGEVLAS